MARSGRRRGARLGRRQPALDAGHETHGEEPRPDVCRQNAPSLLGHLAIHFEIATVVSGMSVLEQWHG